MSVQAGQDAPDFTLKNTERQDVTLSSLRGQKNVVGVICALCLYWCVYNELCSVRDDLSNYANLNAEVLAISVDSPFAQKQWKDKENLNFTLLSDFNREVCKTYGAYYDNFNGFQGVAKRAAFVIDKTGKVQYAEILDSAGKPAQF